MTDDDDKPIALPLVLHARSRGNDMEWPNIFFYFIGIGRIVLEPTPSSTVLQLTY